MRSLPVPASLSHGRWIQVVRIQYRPGDGYDLHDHAFGECFWIERGEALHTVNGIDQRLGPGMLTIMRPPDAHRFATTAGFVMVNVTYRADLLPPLAQRLAGDLDVWPWGDAPMPVQRHLPPAAVERLQESAEELAGDASRLAAEGFLIDLLRLLRRGAAPASAPAWLEQAVQSLASPRHLAAGPAELARLCGRAPAHVNRVVRATYGCTTTELVNRIRLDQAARRLKLSRDGIADIAAGCGYASLAHFYRAFAARFRTTPRAFRLSHQAVGRTVPEEFRTGEPVPVTRPDPRPR
ncbi:MAG: helix-turn-helix domain-containing protein [Planctomycetes bacterium]|nr:helix-turn-helix domain-containing protein [Planctomycetota bacterium]